VVDVLKIASAVSIKNVKIYNITGQIVYTQQPDKNELNVSRLAKGNYIIHIQLDDNTSVVKKFIKY
jgi:hypothetical protein